MCADLWVSGGNVALISQKLDSSCSFVSVEPTSQPLSSPLTDFSVGDEEASQAVAATLRPILPAIADEIVDAIASQVDGYARLMEGRFSRGVRRATARALSRFCDLISNASGDEDRGRRIYVEIGRGEFAQGRSLDALLGAYRVGARVAFRRFTVVGSEAGFAPDVIYRLGEAMFDYIDRLSAESAEGYAEAKSEAAGETQRRRRRLVALLADIEGADPEALRTAARDAGWRLPKRLAVAVLAGDENPESISTRLGPETIGAQFERRTIILIGDPLAPGKPDAIRRALRGIDAAIGPAVAPDEAGKSMHRARLTYDLLERGLLKVERPVFADEHLADLLLNVDPEIGQALARQKLAPLEDLGTSARRKLRETLRAWIDHQGRIEQVAATLDIHPQTVRYRLTQLRDAFGDALDDPDQRFALGLALRIGSGE